MISKIKVIEIGYVVGRPTDQGKIKPESESLKRHLMQTCTGSKTTAFL